MKVNENIADFKRKDPAVDAGRRLKEDFKQKEVIDKVLGIEGYVKPKHSNRPTTKIANIEDEAEGDYPEHEEEPEEQKEYEHPSTPQKEDNVEVDQDDIVYSSGQTPDYDYINKDEIEVAQNQDDADKQEPGIKNPNFSTPNKDSEGSQNERSHEESDHGSGSGSD